MFEGSQSETVDVQSSFDSLNAFFDVVGAGLDCTGSGVRCEPEPPHRSEELGLRRGCCVDLLLNESALCRLVLGSEHTQVTYV